MPNAINFPELYSSIVVAGVRSPGVVVSITGNDRKIGWDIKKGSGQAGATMTRTSEDPVPFTVTIYLATDEDFALWADFKELIDSTVSGPSPKALDIFHPDLAEQGISSIVKDTSVGTVHDGKGGQTKALKLIEYRPPVKKGGSPSGAKTKPPDKPDPNAEKLAELASLTDEYKRTPWGPPPGEKSLLDRLFGR